VEKKPGFNIEAEHLFADLTENLNIRGLKRIRTVNRYDIAGLTEEEYRRARDIVFAEPPVDNVYEEALPLAPDAKYFAVELLPGQYDQRADSAAQCIQVITQREQPKIRYAKVIILEGDISADDLKAIKRYYINPVESREAMWEKPDRLEEEFVEPEPIPDVEGFITADTQELERIHAELGLAMDLRDLACCQAYFRDVEKRNPTLTEIRVIDTYWSDHCRHTTFNTHIDQVEIAAGRYTAPINEAYAAYRQARQAVYGDRPRPMSLMDIAVMGMKELRRQGLLDDLDESDEINACSIIVPAEIDGQVEEWLVMFKNETHNHPTEIEPFGGAATCLGGCIRDPLSGRVYVYQAMRLTGSGDPRQSVADTLPGKLPQRKITTAAAAGYSSYGNQIGLATGKVTEVYANEFIAKRMEIGAVIGAAPRRNVVRKQPQPGDVMILLGGRTGRDGCGGATGSSKAHTEESLATCGAEVQRGNAPTERKIQRLFRHPQVVRMIKRCNDFGAGGVSVAIGELTGGVRINLDAIPKKYEGLDGTELAISESQERMAVVVSAEDSDLFIALAASENLEATVVATVTAEQRLVMTWRGRTIVDISRDFLNTNGAERHADVHVTAPADADYFSELPLVKKETDLKESWLENLRDLNVCSQQGLGEQFDSTVGAATVLLPFGGKYQLTPAESMVAKLPVLKGDTTTGTIMAHGYNPQLALWSPFHGAVYAIVEAVTRVVATGGDYQRVRLTLQEYFERLGTDPQKWGKPFSAVLGAYYVQKALGIPAIGGKDSMSGTFKDMNVPPTLAAFAVAPVDVREVISPEFKQAGNPVVLLPVGRDDQGMPDFAAMKRNFAKVRELVVKGVVRAAKSINFGGLAAALSQMCFGNKLGFAFTAQLSRSELFTPAYGSIVLELAANIDLAEALNGCHYRLLGYTQADPVLAINDVTILLDEALAAWQEPLAGVFPIKATREAPEPPHIADPRRPRRRKAGITVAKPRVLIPVFPGTNCEYESARAFEEAGGKVEILVINNLTPKALGQSLVTLAKRITRSQIVMLPGGFSAGDEPDGSGKFIAAVFRNERVTDAVRTLLQKNDGLMLGICNGFQALIKLGLVPYGDIVDLTADSPTLTHNLIGRHVSRMVNTKVVSTLSPWFNNAQVGDIHTIAVSHGEGRFVASEEMLAQLIANGQIATQYVDFDGNPSKDIAFNPNGSVAAVEGITSPDGRVLGKMGHSERRGNYVAINVPGNKDQQIFAAGINYFK